ncbi:hypothetical protein P8C59_005686 [Phyllachora maydis]|uniref:Arabinan endo-1,5-alpha-L-arabinosidase n=1 Tax=Phyllachora maydis TaxID=1825666 RepID=A0AAD9I5B9_9PEZI|nr:hypothetical protein P8C59_005686 [Phyllachora maydis]
MALLGGERDQEYHAYVRGIRDGGTHLRPSMLFQQLLASAASLLLSVRAVSAAAAAAAAAAAVDFPEPGACTGDCFAHDPALVRRASDGAYFRFNTGNEIGIWKAGNVTGPWVYQGKALPSGSSVKQAGNTDLWAPDVQLVGTRYMMYYTVSTGGSHTSAIGYASSPTMEHGSWIDHGGVGISSNSARPYNAIDANLIRAGSSYYLSFGSYWKNIFQVKLNDEATAASGASYQIAYNASGKHSVEGSFMWHHDDYYYLFFSSGACCDYDKSRPAAGGEYKIFVCRSASVKGPYVDADGRNCTDGGGTLVLASHGNVYGPGGQGVLEDAAGTILYYHYANTEIGLGDGQYQFGWNLLGWADGWPILW